VRALYATVTDVGWALLVAPELWCVREEWFACRRRERDAERLRRLRNRVQRAAEDPDVLSVIEVSSGKVLAIPEQARVVGEIKVGPDVLSVRASAVAKVQAEITRIEDSLGRRRKALHEYVQAYQARVLQVEGMTLQQQAAALMRRERERAARVVGGSGQAAVRGLMAALGRFFGAGRRTFVTSSHSGDTFASH
jgi:hypothetical protein